jgi:hypothetical protein
MSSEARKLIDPLSSASLHLGLFANDTLLGTATGFVVQHNQKPFLVTNWHVLAGRHPDTYQALAQTGALPDEVRMMHHWGEHLGGRMAKSEPLFDAEGKHFWLEHPLGREIDVVALPLTSLDKGVVLYPLNLDLANHFAVPWIGLPVSIIGFPLGLTSEMDFPIWKTGHIASEFEVDYKGKPVFLVDATTRSGMSGSPVVLRLYGGCHENVGGQLIYWGAKGAVTRFLGVYAGRIHNQAEVGYVWKPRVITEILAQR